LSGFPGTAGGIARGVLERILDHARLTPDRPAASDAERELTYGQLAAEVDEVAHGLSGRGVRTGDRVAIHLTNSVDFVVAALASLCVGAIFVPLAATDPEARLEVITGDCDPAVVVTGATGGEAAVLAHPRSVPLEGLRTAPPAGTVEAVPAELGAAGGAGPAYAIYTSGTTGTPKGVLIGQGAFAAAVAATIDSLDLDAGTRTLCVSAFHFDGSFATLFPTLVAGGRLVIPPRDSLLFPRTFFRAVARNGITYTGFSPSYLRLLLGSPQVGGLAETPLRVIALGGEASSRADVEAFRAVAPEVRIFNRYGPTETTIAVTHHEVLPAGPGVPVPIGRPHAGVTFTLVDEHGAVVDRPDTVGELYIGGDQLMDGYWQAPELTAAVLRNDVVPGTTTYRTGDLISRMPSGDHLYVDRADRVIKRSGVRISLVELTEVLRGVPGVSAAASVLYDEDGHLGIVGFVAVGDALEAHDVQRAARLHLPATMLPDRVVVVPAIPLTPAGKVDERALMAGAGLARWRGGA
jgi:D-alanine--poly(phosphoribitol) ligase subunit 1